MTFRSFVGIATQYEAQFETAWLCRLCAEASYQAHGVRILLCGPLGFGIFMAPVFLLGNYLTMSRLRALPAPMITGYAVAADGTATRVVSAACLPAGKPLRRRWLTYVSLLLGPILALIIMGAIVAVTAWASGG